MPIHGRAQMGGHQGEALGRRALRRVGPVNPPIHCWLRDIPVQNRLAPITSGTFDRFVTQRANSVRKRLEDVRGGFHVSLALDIGLYFHPSFLHL